MGALFLSARFTHWWLGIATGFVTSVVVTLIIVVWEWLENPGGIFRNADGTNWRFLADTALSWFVPTFVHVAVIASIAHLLWSVIRRHRHRNVR